MKIYVVKEIFYVLFMALFALSANADPGQQTIVEDRALSFFDINTILPQSLKTDAHARQVAFVIQIGSKQRMVINGQTGPEFSGVGAGDPEFSDNGRTAYLGILDAGECMVIDGKQQPIYDLVGRPPAIFSPDGKRTAYAAQIENEQFVILDGAAQPRFDGVSASSIQFSSDSIRLAYVATANNLQTVVIDGKPTLWHSGIGKGTLQFSPDSKHFAYVALEEDGQKVVVDGEKMMTFTGIVEGTLTFSPDSQRLLYVSTAEKKQSLVVDNEQQSVFDAVFLPTKPFSPDSKTFAYVAQNKEQQYLVTNSNRGPSYDAIGIDTISFSCDSSRLAYAARKGGRSFVSIDQTEFGPYDGIGAGPITFSPDSLHAAFAAQAGNKHFVVVDGTAGNNYDGIGRGTITFSPDSEHIAYAVQSEENFKVVVDNIELPPVSFLLSTDIIFTDALHVIYSAAVAEGQAVVVNGHPGMVHDLLLLQGGGIVLDGPKAYHHAAINKNVVSLISTAINETCPDWPGLPVPQNLPVDSHDKPKLPETIVESLSVDWLLLEAQKEVVGVKNPDIRNQLLAQLSRILAQSGKIETAFKILTVIDESHLRLTSTSDVLDAMRKINSDSVHWNSVVAEVVQLPDGVKKAELFFRLGLIAHKNNLNSVNRFMQDGLDILSHYSSEADISEGFFAAAEVLYHTAQKELGNRLVALIEKRLSRIQDAFTKSVKMVRLAQVLAETAPNKSERLLKNASAAIANIKPESSEVLALIALTRTLQSLGDKEYVQQNIRKLLALISKLPENERCPALLEIAEIHLLDAREFEAAKLLTEALGTTQRISNIHYRAWCLYRIGSNYLQLNRPKQAETIVNLITEEKTVYKVLLMTELAQLYDVTGKDNKKSVSLQKYVLQRLQRITDSELKASALLDVLQLISKKDSQNIRDS